MTEEFREWIFNQLKEMWKRISHEFINNIPQDEVDNFFELSDRLMHGRLEELKIIELGFESCTSGDQVVEKIKKIEFLYKELFEKIKEHCESQTNGVETFSLKRGFNELPICSSKNGSQGQTCSGQDNQHGVSKHQVSSKTLRSKRFLPREISEGSL